MQPLEASGEGCQEKDVVPGDAGRWMQTQGMPGEECSSLAMRCLATKGRCNSITLGWRIKAATPCQPGILQHFLMQQGEEKKIWCESGHLWVNHGDKGRRTHGPAHFSSQDGEHQIGSRLTKCAFPQATAMMGH